MVPEEGPVTSSWHMTGGNARGIAGWLRTADATGFWRQTVQSFNSRNSSNPSITVVFAADLYGQSRSVFSGTTNASSESGMRAVRLIRNKARTKKGRFTTHGNTCSCTRRLESSVDDGRWCTCSRATSDPGTSARVRLRCAGWAITKTPRTRCRMPCCRPSNTSQISKGARRCRLGSRRL